MTERALPMLRARSVFSAATCTKCNTVEFKTNVGSGRLYFCGGIHAEAKFGQDPDAPHVASPVICIACGTEHNARVNLPPPQSRMISGG